jgi:hypothetical protein
MGEQGEVLIALAVVGVIVGVGYWLFFRARGRRSYLGQHGVRTLGKLTSVRGVTSAQAYRTTMVHYSFDAPAPGTTEPRTYRGSGPLALGVLQTPREGGDVTILYRQDNPEISMIAGNRGQDGIWTVALAMLTGILIMLVLELFKVF